MTTRLIGLESGPDSAQLLVTRLGDLAGDELTLEVRPRGDKASTDDRVGSRSVPVTGWCQTLTTSRPRREQDRLNWAKPVVDGLEPGRSYRVRLTDQRQLVLDTAVVTTTPADDTRKLRLVAGSCFDVKGDHTLVVDRAYDQLVADDDPVPTYNLWLGDQVYVDAPWYETTTTAKSRSIIFDRYLLTWGLRRTSADDVQIEQAEETDENEQGEEAEQGVGDGTRPDGSTPRGDLHRSMARTSNWFLPDDHEFWNGYPNPGWLTLFGHTLARTAHQSWRWVRGRAGAETESHPATQGPWGKAAGEAYLLFASPVVFDNFSDRWSPTQVQVFGSPDVAVVMVDTRWHRTILKKGRQSGFMTDDDLRHVVDLLRTEERLVCLGLSRPLIGHLPHRGIIRRQIEYGAEDFPAQYTELWRALSNRRKAGRPTLVVSGDVHHHAIRTADDDGVLEVVSSPLAMLGALDGDSNLNQLHNSWRRVRGGLQRAWLTVKGGLRWGEEQLRPDLDSPGNQAAYPAFGPDGNWHASTGRVVFEADERQFMDVNQRGLRLPIEPSGLCSIEIDSTDADHTVTVSSVLGITNSRGETITRRQDHTFRWDRTGDSSAAWL